MVGFGEFKLVDIHGLSSAMPPINRAVKCFEESFNSRHRSHVDGIERKRTTVGDEN